jgi:predicted transcriptional regulator
MGRAWRPRVKPRRQPTAASKALFSARNAARLRLDQTAKAVGVHPRTVTRWEIGETKPSADEWARLVALFAMYAPQAAAALAAAAGVPSASPPSRAVDVRAIDAAIIRAADRLDVAPRRVRAALRDILAATESANGTLSDLAQATQPNEDETGPTDVIRSGNQRVG